MNHPLVSVIIPAYNSAASIAEAVGSVIGQTYRSVEAVVVDDGSTDGTEEALKRSFRDGRIRYIRQENGGPGAARNTGIRAAWGAYITFLDADDQLTPDSIKARMSLMTGVPALRLVYANCFLKYSEDRVELRFDERYLKERHGRRETPHGIVLEGSFSELFDIPFEMTTDTVLVERGLLERAGEFRTDIRIGEDRDMWIRLSLHAGGAIGYVPAPAAWYNRHWSRLTAADPVRYALVRERLNRSFLDTYGPLAGRARVRSVINGRLSWVYYDLGVHHDSGNRKFRSAWCLIKSLRLDPSNRVSRRRLAALMVPRGIVVGVRKALGLR
jgi:glycosyltransferase involved in cell wall biosynthesis